MVYVQRISATVGVFDSQYKKEAYLHCAPMDGIFWDWAMEAMGLQERAKLKT